MPDKNLPLLVTGATGFVGASLTRVLLKEGFNVRVFVRRNSNRLNLEGLNVTIAEGSLEDEASIVSAMRGCAGLFHVAASYKLWTKDKEALLRTNIDGTRRIMMIALSLRIPRIVYTSSVATLGNIKGGIADETTPSCLEDMIGIYKISKFIAEDEVHRLVRENGLPAVIVNPSAPIGPYDVKPTPTGRMVVEAVAGRMPAFVDTGLNFVHVEDVAIGHLLAFTRGRVGERYILGGSNMKLKEFLVLIATEAKRDPPRWRLPRRLLYPLAYASEGIASITHKEPLITVDALKMAAHPMYYNSAKAEHLLGYRARPVFEAVSDAISWFRAMKYCS